MKPSHANLSGIRKGWFFILLVAALLIGASWLVRWMAGGASGLAPGEMRPPAENASSEEETLESGAVPPPKETPANVENQGSRAGLPELDSGAPDRPAQGEAATRKTTPGHGGEEQPEPPVDRDETRAETPPPTLCLLSDAGLPGTGDEAAYTLHLPAGISIRAALDGNLVKLMETPFTGKSLYLLSDDGRFALKYEGLGSYATDVIEGRRVVCGSHLGTIATSLENRLSRFSMLEIPRGGSWWQATPVDLSPYSAQLCGPGEPNHD